MSRRSSPSALAARPAAWWPPPALTWVAGAADRDFDLLHLHFGCDDRSADDLREVVDVLVHDFYSDEELWDYLQSIDVSVLP